MLGTASVAVANDGMFIPKDTTVKTASVMFSGRFDCRYDSQLSVISRRIRHWLLQRTKAMIP